MIKRISLSIATISAIFLIAGCSQLQPSNTATSKTQQPATSQVATPQPQQTATSQMSTSQNKTLTQQLAVTQLLPLTQQVALTKIYKNEKYGFKFAYPQDATAAETFKPFHLLTNAWRVDAPDTSKGTPVVSVPVFTTESDTSYPRYFDAELRVGVSENPEDVRNCLNPDPNLNVQTTKKTINGVDFTVIPLQDAAMMQYIEANSYRTVHNGMCFAIEQIKNGSDYRDAPNAKDISDNVLNGYYDQVASMIQSFTFTK